MLPSREGTPGIMARPSPEPSMYRHRPASELTQDISHLLASVFKHMYTSEVIAANTVENMIKSRGGDNSHHEQFVEELQKVHNEYKDRLAEADMLERHIIQARARATVEEERILNMYGMEIPEDYSHLTLPPVKSTFRWCVDDKLLKEHNLICPEDYIMDPELITRAPKDVAEPGYLQEIISFKHHVSDKSHSPRFRKNPHISKILENLPDVSLSSLVLESSSSDISSQAKKSFCKKKPHRSQQSAWKNDMTRAERQKDRAYLQRLDDRHNFLKNPRFFPPNSLHGGKSLILPQTKVQRMIAGRKKTVVESNSQSVPVFLANPPAVVFSYYEVGQVYEMTIELQNMTSTSQCMRIIPPASPAFSIGLGKFPGEGGLVAPGMCCYYVVQFIPEYLADYKDYILIESQTTYPLLVPLEGRRPPPILTLPHILDCGACLVGGVKFTEFLCKNEGPNVGKFCIMPEDMWPPPHFRAVATFGFVEQEPFGIRPAVFELAPGQSTLIEVVFMPFLPKMMSVKYIIVCDNCQMNEITVTGLGQLIGLKLLSVSGGESSPVPGELVDVTAQHLIRFAALNPKSMTEKTLVLRNLTHVEFPFFWQIMKPNLQPLMLEGKPDLTKIKYNLETESAFSVTPAMGVLHPHTNHSFTLTFFPKKLKEYHSVLQIVLEDIPELPLPEKLEQYESGERRQEDVIALEIDVKGETEPYQLLLEPYAIILPGENYIGVNVRRTFKMYNNSKSSVKFTWGKISECDIVEVEPCSGKLGANESQEFEFIITGGKPGHSCHDLQCKIAHSEEPVVLHVEADFKGPVLSIDVPSFDLGLLKLGEKVLFTFEIENLSQLPGNWKIQESPECLAERNEEASPFTVQPPSGELCPLGKCSISVLFTSYTCQHLQTVLEMEVENGVGSHIPVSVEVQTPHVCLLSSHLNFDLSAGIPAEATVQLVNQTLLPTCFQWGELLGSQASSCVLSISPESGTLGPNEIMEFRVMITTNIKEKLSDLVLCCSIEDMLDPLFLAISGKVKGLQITYSIPFDSDEEYSQDLKLDFGSEVALKSVIKRQLIITNHSELAALFSIEVDYFSQPCPVPSDEQGPDGCTKTVVEKTRHVTLQIAKKKQSAFRAAMLSHEKGATFHVHPSAGILKAFQELVVEITAYNNMWGQYEDSLICKVGESEPMLIPIQMTVKGCPIFLQVTGPNHPMPAPIIRFGAHISGGDTVSRYIRLNNPTPFDIRMDWESYNQDKDDDKLVDLLVFYGAPFPIKDLDGNEIEVLWEAEMLPKKMSRSSGSTSHLSPKENLSLDPIFEDDEGESNDGDDSCRPLDPKKIISVVLRPHEGLPSDYPFCITPKQVVIPAGGATAIHISFTPLMLPEIINKFECEGFALGFMSLDSPIVRKIPGKVTRGDGHTIAPLRIDLQAFVKPALLTVEMDHESGLVFHALASALILDVPLKGVLTESATTLNVKLTNNTETPLSFKLILTMPFSVSGIDPKKSLKTSHSGRNEGEHHLALCALENMLVKVSFHTSLELLTYQHLPEDQLLPGLRVLEFENGDKILEFKQNLIIEYSNKATQMKMNGTKNLKCFPSPQIMAFLKHIRVACLPKFLWWFASHQGRTWSMKP
ncbi:deleted in lung and esophageal cancer protein 1 isoform X2 [Rhineura floridana]|uniref:deleted in lung and esophageal cancer protein 1 isoform X2 n=1 Tax=Rhineura floridana TaxID=261503 RepID=UPI002AC7EB6E|nr:deleted in lung and esophageal cancer protein 1 isoform X2 [Rhineura floridana]